MSINPLTKILVIDDEEKVRLSVSMYLEDMGFDVITARNGHEGLAKFRNDKPSLVLVDLLMSGLDGFEIISLIEAESPETPSIVISGTGNISDAVKAINQGAWDFILKPIEDMSVLLHSVNRTLERAHLLSSNQQYQNHLEELIRQKSKKLARSESELEAIVSSVNDIILRLTPEGNISFVNEAVRQYGYDPYELAGENFLDLIKSDEIEIIKHLISDASLKNSILNSFEIKLRTLSDYLFQKDIKEDVLSSRIFQLDIKRLFDLDETNLLTFIGSQGTIREITQQKESAEKLRESEEKYRTLVEKSLQGVVIAKDNPLSIIFANQTMGSILGYLPEDLTRFNFEEIKEHVFPEDRKRFYDTFKALIVDKSHTSSHEYRLIHKDGSIKWVEAHISYIDYNHQPACMLVIIDLTDQKVLEAQFQQAQKMEAIGRLAGGMAHDFNNMLTAIAGNAELAIMSLSENEPVRRDIEEIISISDKASKLTKQLLAFGKKQLVEPKVLNLNDTLRSMSRMLIRVLGEDIELEVRYNPEIHSVYADQNQIEQVVVNLAINARDAMKNGGLLIIETSNKRIENEKIKFHQGEVFGDYVALTIIDNGHGISEEQQKHIFEPFYTTKEDSRGTGLGLSSVYSIVKQNHGYIDFKSEVSKGSSFTIYLPRTSRKEDKPFHMDNKRKDLFGSELVLIVEDETEVREITGRILKQYGYQVLKAATCEKALDYYFDSENKVDLILTDIVMPRMSGPEMVNLVRENRPDVKVIFMSGYPEEIIKEHGIIKPDINFISKPYNPVALLKKIRLTLNS